MSAGLEMLKEGIANAKDGEEMMSSEKGLEMMRQVTANEPTQEEPEPMRLLRLANSELGDGVGKRLGMLEERLAPYLGYAVPKTDDGLAKELEDEHVPITKLIKLNRQLIAKTISFLDSLMERLNY